MKKVPQMVFPLKLSKLYSLQLSPDIPFTKKLKVSNPLRHTAHNMLKQNMFAALGSGNKWLLLLREARKGILGLQSKFLP